jgi:hypothetical protein
MPLVGKVGEATIHTFSSQSDSKLSLKRVGIFKLLYRIKHTARVLVKYYIRNFC